MKKRLKNRMRFINNLIGYPIGILASFFSSIFFLSKREKIMPFFDRWKENYEIQKELGIIEKEKLK
jgi:hypothetical protein